MTHLIWGCYNWVGFHLVNEFLEEGSNVIGVDHIQSKRNDILDLLIGRNANFVRYEELGDMAEADSYTSFSSIMVFSSPQQKVPWKKLELLSTSARYHIVPSPKERVPMEDWTTVVMPKLFGPWMMEAEDTISEESLYIGDFIDWLKILPEKGGRSPILRVGVDGKSPKDLEVLLSQDTSIEQGKEILNAHKDRYPMYY